MEQSAAALTMPYPWQGDQWDVIAAQYEARRLPHAIMLNGPPQVGKSQFARALAQLVLCDAPLGGYACGNCKACKLVAAGSHPDLKIAMPEEEGKAVKIDQIRAVRDFIAQTSQQGGWKVVIVEPAEAMNINSSNALLKSLEEPSDNTLLILVCHQVSAVSATIRSRCRMIPFAVPAPSLSLDWLMQVVTSEQDPEWLLEQAGGRPLQALKLVESDLLEQRTEFFDLLEQIAQSQMSAVVAAEKCYRKNAFERLEWLMLRVAERIQQAPGSPRTRNWFRFWDRLVTAKRELQGSSNPNMQLLWESLLLDWQALADTRR